MTAKEYVLQRILDRMTEKERRDYLLLSTMSRDRDDVLSAINEQGAKLDIISRKQSWLNDFSANIAANASWDALIYIASRLLKNIK